MANRKQLRRFHEAQKSRSSSMPGFDMAFKEIQAGQKTSHWIWYIFPQLSGLGMSSNAQKYGLDGLQETCYYLQDSVLFNNYYQIVEEVLQKIQHRPINSLMGSSIDAQKLMSSLTLFQAATSYLCAMHQEPVDKYRKLQELCQRILAIAANQGLFSCKKTLELIKKDKQQGFELEPQTKIQQPIKTAKVQEITPILPTVKTVEKTPNTKLISQLDTYAQDRNKVQEITPTLPTAKTVEKTPNTKLISQLDAYVQDRKKEWSFHYNFLGIMSFIYFIQDKLSGTNYFDSKSREVKISAASKLKTGLETPDSSPNFTQAEHEALQEGRLGKIVAAHGGISTTMKSLTDTAVDTQTRSQQPKF